MTLAPPVTLLVWVPLAVVLGALLYECLAELVRWLVRPSSAGGWTILWAALAATFTASRLTQRVWYASDAVTIGSVYVQFAAGALLMPTAALAARAIAATPPTPRLVVRLFGAAIAALVVMFGLTVKPELLDRTDLFGAPVRVLRFGASTLALVPVLVWATADATRTLRTSGPSPRTDRDRQANVVLGGATLLLSVFAVNDILLGAGAIRTIQLTHFGLLIVMGAAGYLFEYRRVLAQTRLDEAIASRTREREAALDEVKRGAERFRMLAESTVEAVVLHEAGKIVDSNGRATAMLGYDSEHLRALAVVECFDEASLPSIRTLLAGESGGPVEARGRRRDGTTLPVEVSATRGSLASSEGGILAIRDMSEREAMNRRLMFADRMASIGTLAAGTAHEINNPLAFVTLNLAHLSDQLDTGALGPLAPADAANVRSLIDEARAGCSRIARVVQDLRTLSTPEDEGAPAHADLATVVESAVKMTQLETRHSARVVSSHEAGVRVAASEARLLQVCLNLIINAAQAIPIGHVEDNEIQLVTRREGPNAVLEVRDTGSGIAPQNLARVFDPFFTTKPVGTGTGLGLSICHSIVTSLGGTIDVESTLGKGTCFRVTLPAAPPAPAPEPAPPLAPAAAGTGAGRVLIIDDEVSLGRALARVLKGFDVTVVESGRRGIAELETGNFDAIVCDLMMPEVSGLEVFEFVQRRRPELAPRFLLMTGGALTEQATRVLGDHAVRAMTKPIDLDLLRRTVRELLAGRAS